MDSRFCGNDVNEQYWVRPIIYMGAQPAGCAGKQMSSRIDAPHVG